MQKYIDNLPDTVFWFLVMGLLTVIKEGIKTAGEWSWRRSSSKFLANVIAGAGFYSFLLSYKPWYGEYPQKIGVIMLVVYVGSSLIDIVTDKIIDGFKNGWAKDVVRKLFNL